MGADEEEAEAGVCWCWCWCWWRGVAADDDDEAAGMFMGVSGSELGWSEMAKGSMAAAAAAELDGYDVNLAIRVCGF